MKLHEHLMDLIERGIEFSIDYDPTAQIATLELDGYYEEVLIKDSGDFKEIIGYIVEHSKESQ